MLLERTIKLKLVPLDTESRRLLHDLLKKYAELLAEAQRLVVELDIRSVKRAHEALYKLLREMHRELHNKYAEEAYRRALANYRSYLKLKRKWEKRLRRLGFEEPRPPSAEGNKVIDLHISAFRLSPPLLEVSYGGGKTMKFLAMPNPLLAKYAGWRIGNSKILVDKGSAYLFLTVRRNVEPEARPNRIYVDVNESSIDLLVADWGHGLGLFLSVMHEGKEIRRRYRILRRSIQKKVREIRRRNQLLRKYGKRERERVNQAVRRAAKLMADLALAYNADVVVEKLKDVTWRPRGNGELNYRLRSLPYRRIVESIRDKAAERGVRVLEVDARNTSVECPICGHADKKNRKSTTEFRCTKCGFELHAQLVPTVNLARRCEGVVARPAGQEALLTLEEAPVVSSGEAPHDPVNHDPARGKALPVPKTAKIIKI
ncbi:IS200/IS605 family element transposase accessory protein TnpB [Infirmifilum lucidum]|uniref:IS200/IS605 family element transposase accessory protein TnpB n=1 Tax=Infirmifilum lucidum TaxID=2776706 RepID=A0A7L9FGR7_9CREN|nr:RNA-guided endonuclease TnpB family protein [Infirmifilum lucidum]QOJ78907.1 IS200/IS605 family element transposase accessory protein TnpB [Infirmifilum lucidum]